MLAIEEVQQAMAAADAAAQAEETPAVAPARSGQLAVQVAPTRLPGGVVSKAPLAELDLEEDLVAGGAEEGSQVYSIRIAPESEWAVKKKLDEHQLGIPLAEYDFANDDETAALPIDVKPDCVIWQHQEKGLAKMFSHGRARSGIIVLPCGAGKTLVGVTAAAHLRRSCVVLCTSVVAVEQWRNQFKLWTTLRDSEIFRFTSHSEQMQLREDGSGPRITNCVITTYKMISFKGKRSMAAARVMEQIKSRQWGLLLLDEVHVFPAKNMQELVFDVKAHCKLGLTATLVREDNKIDTLNFSVGPKLYEANWQDLANSGYLARVQCSEVWCPMTPEFYNLYLNEGNWQHRGALCAFNPNKFRAVAHLMRYHEARGEKVLIFSQDIAVLKMFSGLLNRYHIYGALNWPERLEILKKFKHSTTTNTLCLSSVGDDAIDLPDANVIIQVSAHAGSRRQEAQRLGRILRRKSTPAPADGSPNAWFYTLVSQDTQEMYFSTKRQQFLVDQGYSFQVMSDVKDDKGDSVFNTLDLELDKKLMTAALHKDEQDEVRHGGWMLCAWMGVTWCRMRWSLERVEPSGGSGR